MGRRRVVRGPDHGRARSHSGDEVSRGRRWEWEAGSRRGGGPALGVGVVGEEEGSGGALV